MARAVDFAPDDDLRPLPAGARLGLVYPALIWSGFGAAFVCVLIGNRLQRDLGTFDALLAILIGNWLLFVYSAAIGFACGRWGLTAPLMLREAFGRLAGVVPILLLAVLVCGWFAVQVDLAVVIVGQVVGGMDAGTHRLVLVLLGILFTLPVAAGARQGFAVAALAMPAMLLFAGLTVGHLVAQPSGLLDGPVFGPMSFELGIAVAFACFAVSGTMTGDIVRHARTGDQAVLVTVVAFLLSNLPFLIFGALLAAAGIDVMALFTPQMSPGVAPLLAALAVISSWAACDACLANAALALRSVFPRLPAFPTAALLGAGSTAVAMAGLLDDLTTWMLWLVVLVPPVGAVVIADYYLVRNQSGVRERRAAPVNAAALAAMAAGTLVGALGMHSPEAMGFPVAGAVVTLVVYPALAWAAPDLLGTRLGARAPADGDDDE